MPFTYEDPRFLPGSISGAGMETSGAGRIVDTRFAVNLDMVDACLIEHPRPGNPVYAVALGGTVHGSPDRARCVYLIPPDGAGVLVDRLVNLAAMIGPEFARALLERVQRLQPQGRPPQGNPYPLSPSAEISVPAGPLTAEVTQENGGHQDSAGDQRVA